MIFDPFQNSHLWVVSALDISKTAAHLEKF